MPAAVRLAAAAATVTVAVVGVEVVTAPPTHAPEGAVAEWTSGVPDERVVPDGPSPVTDGRAVQRPERDHRAGAVLAGMTLRQRVGQVFMVGTPATAADRRVLSAISDRHVGNVMLTGRAHGGVRSPARVAAQAQARTTRSATAQVGLLVSTDQEGGLVQVLNGPGLTDIPDALTQGSWSPARLRDRAAAWARQLRRAGVNMNLAPVVDTVAGPRAARRNPPIGAFDRQFGHGAQAAARHGRAFLRGMWDHGVVPTAKHFPGLGRVRANPDTAGRVTDRRTRRHDPALRPFEAAVDAGVPVVMMSTAYYAHLDRQRPAAFSPTIVRGMLRGDLGFDGVVVSDDLGSARQVSRWQPGARAVKFLRAGGDLTLTVDPATLPPMYDAVLAEARTDASFRERVSSAALRVLRLKERRGLLPTPR